MRSSALCIARPSVSCPTTAPRRMRHKMSGHEGLYFRQRGVDPSDRYSELDVSWTDRWRKIKREVPEQWRELKERITGHHGYHLHRGVEYDLPQGIIRGWNPRASAHGELMLQWNFTDGGKSLKQFQVNCDSDENEGFSQAKVTETSSGVLFHGNIDTRVPRDGLTFRSGWASFGSLFKTTLFHHKSAHESWGSFNHVVMKVRGDGREYTCGLAVQRPFGWTPNVVYGHPLHTRGGPYWQYVTIPFSKFFMTYRGRIQDSQWQLNPRRIRRLYITMHDRHDGPFSLEIAWIGLMYDCSHFSTQNWEMYRMPIILGP